MAHAIFYGTVLIIIPGQMATHLILRDAFKNTSHRLIVPNHLLPKLRPHLNHGDYLELICEITGTHDQVHFTVQTWETNRRVA